MGCAKSVLADPIARNDPEDGPVTTTLTRNRRVSTPKSSAASARQVKEMLVELAYRLHTTKVVKRLPITHKN